MLLLIGSCLFGLVFVLLGVWMLKAKRLAETLPNVKVFAIIEFIGGGLFLVGGIIAIILSIPEIKETTTTPQELIAEKESVALKWTISSSSYPGTIDIELLQSVLDWFSTNCYGITNYSESIDSAVVTIRRHEPSQFLIYRQEEYSWMTEIEINLTINRDSNLMIGEYLIAGHTLYYFLGGGSSPGIETMKDESAIFLGIDEANIAKGTNLHIPIEGFEAIDNLILE